MSTIPQLCSAATQPPTISALPDDLDVLIGMLRRGHTQYNNLRTTYLHILRTFEHARHHWELLVTMERKLSEAEKVLSTHTAAEKELMTIFKDLRLVSTNRMKRVDSSHVWHRKKKTNAAKAAMAALCKSFPDRVRVKNIAFSISMTADDSPLDRDMWVMNENLETMRVADRDDTTYILRHPVPNSEYVDTNGKCNSTAHQKYGGTGRYLDEIYNTAIEHDNLFKKPWKRKSKNCMGRENVRAENIYHRDDYTNECSDVEYEDCDSSDADECVGNTLGNNIPLGINK